VRYDRALVRAALAAGSAPGVVPAELAAELRRAPAAPAWAVGDAAEYYSQSPARQTGGGPAVHG